MNVMDPAHMSGQNPCASEMVLGVFLVFVWLIQKEFPGGCPGLLMGSSETVVFSPPWEVQADLSQTLAGLRKQVSGQDTSLHLYLAHVLTGALGLRV